MVQRLGVLKGYIYILHIWVWLKIQELRTPLAETLRTAEDGGWSCRFSVQATAELRTSRSRRRMPGENRTVELGAGLGRFFLLPLVVVKGLYRAYRDSRFHCWTFFFSGGAEANGGYCTAESNSSFAAGS